MSHYIIDVHYQGTIHVLSNSLYPPKQEKEKVTMIIYIPSGTPVTSGCTIVDATRAPDSIIW